jgi:phosphopantetheinyl transferase
MPIIENIQKDDYTLLVWKVQEPNSFFEQQLQLSPTEKENLFKRFKYPEALTNWMVSRFLLQQLTSIDFRALKRTSQGKLTLPDSTQHISISHSGQWIAVALSEKAIGIDIQTSTPKLAKIAAKYIEANRLRVLQNQPTIIYQDYLHYYWGIKEALFKAYGLGKVDYRTHLQIKYFDHQLKGNTTASIIKPNYEGMYQINYLKTEDYYLCTAVVID